MNLEQTIRDNIKEVAHDLVMQFGIRSVSMDDIAQKMGKSKKTIYKHFNDKDELIEAVVEDVITKNQCNCNIDRKDSINAIHEIFLVMDMIVQMFRTMNPSILFDLQKYHPAAFQNFLRHRNEYLFEVTKANLERGISEGLYRKEINTNIIARLRIENMFLPFNIEFQRKLNTTLLEIEEEIIVHYLFGLVTEKGYALILEYMMKRDGIKNIKS